MCGIVGYVGQRKVGDVLLKGLSRLEYRGYDSTGVAYFKGAHIEVKKSEGKLRNIEEMVKRDPSADRLQCGIGHTRWATHGRPTTQNAHPHRTNHIVLVHNGIIENFESIRADMIKLGHSPASETDSELFGFLVLEEEKKGTDFPTSVQNAFRHLEGACSVVVMSEKQPGLIVGVRNGSPLVVALDPQGGAVFASDAQPLLEYTREVFFLEHGDMAIGSEKGITFRDIRTGKEVKREKTLLDWSADKLDKQGFPHYMLKEIFEQPLTMVDTLNGLLDRARTDPFPMAQQPGLAILEKAEEIIFIACGTSWHAALLGKYWLERWAGIPVSVELASEFRYRDPVVRRGTVIIGISQSGETADTLAAVNDMRRRGIPTMAICNVRGSTMSREVDATFFTSAGPEVGVAATKTFYAQMLAVFIMAGYLGLRRGRDTASKIPHIFQQLLKVPHMLESQLQQDGKFVKQIKEVAKRVVAQKGFFFVGRGYSFPISLEGALKLKEIAYVHAEGYAAGELKHGPIAMLDEDMAVVVLAPKDGWHEKTVSNLQEVKARGARIIGIGNPDDDKMKRFSDEFIPLPMPVGGESLDESLYPFLLAPAIQLLSYEIALLKGTDIDQPKNLAKSVTVE
ncbi:MAG: glutamine--fructose-6-phosphate transaminase (isomerizing) [Bdellovibrionales bacterium]|nr:glutamine--fructose-6-phosphate transaminase (isomerizing) [Bdellovibrionales bacterium]